MSARTKKTLAVAVLNSEEEFPFKTAAGPPTASDSGEEVRVRGAAKQTENPD